MPCLKNPRYERLAQGLSIGKSQADAYVFAGYPDKTRQGKKISIKDLASSASVICKKPEVIARVAELQKKQADRCGVTVDKLLSKLEEMFILSKRTKQPSAGVGAVLAQAKLLGLVTDKVEVEGHIRKPSSVPTDQQQMSLEEWQAKFAPKVLQ